MLMKTIVSPLLFLTAASFSPLATAQAADTLVGTWQLVSSDNILNGKKTPIYGESLQGLTIFTADGHYMTEYVRQDLPKFASNSRIAGIPEENKAVVQGSIASFGHYTVNDVNREIIFNIERSTFPNWVGAVQKRAYTLVGNELRYTVSGASTGQGNAEVVLKRIGK